MALVNPVVKAETNMDVIDRTPPQLWIQQQHCSQHAVGLLSVASSMPLFTLVSVFSTSLFSVHSHRQRASEIAV